MKTFFESLLQSNPEISEDSASQFRSGLTVVINQLHEENDQAMQRSLLNWAEWLNDNGYDSNSLLTILSYVAEATIGKPAREELETYIQSNATKPLGLPHLVEHLQASYPELAQAIEELEAQAVEEERELASMAGGMSKKDRVIVGSSVAGLVLTGLGVGVYKYKQWAKEKEVRAADNAKDKFHTDLATSSVKSEFTLTSNQLFGEGLNRGLNKEMLKRAMENPVSDVPQVKSLEKYGEKDIETHAEELAVRHVLRFGESLENRTITLLKGELKTVERDIRDNPEFQRQVRRDFAELSVETDGLSWPEIQKLPNYKKVEDSILNDTDFTDFQIKDYIRNVGPKDAMVKGFQEIKEAYALQLREDIKAASERAARKEGFKWYDTVRPDGEPIIEAKTKIEADILEKTEVLRSAAKRDATAAAQDAVEEGRAAERDTERFL